MLLLINSSFVYDAKDKSKKLFDFSKSFSIEFKVKLFWKNNSVNYMNNSIAAFKVSSCYINRVT